jgi:hypothetical protein
MKNSNDTIGNRTRDLSACSAVPQPTALRRAPIYIYMYVVRLQRVNTQHQELATLKEVLRRTVPIRIGLVSVHIGKSLSCELTELKHSAVNYEQPGQL